MVNVYSGSVSSLQLTLILPKKISEPVSELISFSELELRVCYIFHLN